MGMGLGVFFIPNLVLGSFGFPATNDIWIRILGFCLLRGRTNQVGFFRISVLERVIFFWECPAAGIVLFPPANPLLVLIGSMDLFGVLWIGLTLHRTRSILRDVE